MVYSCDICEALMPCPSMSPVSCADGVFFVCPDCVNKVLSTFPDFRFRLFKDLKRVSRL